jgi:hypothetical protein
VRTTDNAKIITVHTDDCTCIVVCSGAVILFVDIMVMWSGAVILFVDIMVMWSGAAILFVDIMKLLLLPTPPIFMVAIN